MEKRDKKRLLIGAVYAAIFMGAVFLIYQWLKPAPDCFDGIKNQNEEGLDCGGICAKKCDIKTQQDLKVLAAGFAPSGSGNNFDLYAQVENSNQNLGSNKFFYQWTVKDSSGAIIASKSGANFILPGETKYVIENNLAVKDTPDKIELFISNPEWVEANEFYEAPQLKIVNKQYNEISSGVGFSEAVGLLKNESPLDFSKIKIKIILKNDFGKIVAINSTELNTVKSGENREFRAGWPSRFPGSVSNMEIQPEVNVFDSEAFFRRFFKPEKFQQY